MGYLYNILKRKHILSVVIFVMFLICFGARLHGPVTQQVNIHLPWTLEA